MDVAVVGASGDCGRLIVVQLVAERVLAPSDRLQLVGRRGGNSEATLPGLRIDVTDAYAEAAPHIDVALDPEEVTADVIVVAAGRTVPTSLNDGVLPSRRQLAEVNRPLFESLAGAIARHGHGEEVVIVVSNPVELGVEVFSRHLGRHRVVGMGAYLDTLRLRKEIAKELGVRRQMVTGFAAGEHGQHLVPLWSTVKVVGIGDRGGDYLHRRLGLQADAGYHDSLTTHRQQLAKLLAAGAIQEALQEVESLPVDHRLALRPFVTHFSGAKTAVATANATVDLVRTVLGGRDVVVAGQVALEGELFGLTGPLGVPIVLGPAGWSHVVPVNLSREELALLRGASRAVKQLLGGVGA